jgi:ABC-type dipeptide/oligopeptide/nickel transport system ATPase component
MIVIGIGGNPGCGKTTLMRSLIELLGPIKHEKIGSLVYGRIEDAKVFVLGDYRGENVFAGTDRLSMSVQPDAVKVLHHWAKHNPDWTVLFEGDRLFGQSFLDVVQNIECVKLKLFLLDCSPEELARRRKKRNSHQNEIWLKGRESKIKRIAQKFKLKPIDGKEIRSQIKELLNG